jgi:hypothetical protein
LIQFEKELGSRLDFQFTGSQFLRNFFFVHGFRQGF